MQFLGCQNALRYVFSRDSASDPTGKVHSAPSPDLLAALRRPSCKERVRREKKGIEEREKETGSESERKESVKKEKNEEGPKSFFLQETQNLKLGHCR